MKKILLLCVFLGGCNAVDAGTRVVSGLDSLGFNYDTNAYHSKRTGPAPRICEYKIDELHTKWKPC